MLELAELDGEVGRGISSQSTTFQFGDGAFGRGSGCFWGINFPIDQRGDAFFVADDRSYKSRESRYGSEQPVGKLDQYGGGLFQHTVFAHADAPPTWFSVLAAINICRCPNGLYRCSANSKTGLCFKRIGPPLGAQSVEERGGRLGGCSLALSGKGEPRELPYKTFGQNTLFNAEIGSIGRNGIKNGTKIGPS